MLAGIYYGAQYGGSMTAILVNIPGEASSTVTCLDGYAMARRGRAGLALAVAAIGSFVGGTFGTLVLAVLAAPLTTLARRFEAADHAALMVCGLVMAVSVAQGNLWKAIVMVGAGLALGQIGTDVSTGQEHLTFGLPELLDAIGFVPLAIGLFGLSEVIQSLASSGDEEIVPASTHGIWPARGRAAARPWQPCAVPRSALSWGSCPARSKASPAPRPRTMRPPRRRSSPC